MNVQNRDTNMSYERSLASGILAETIKIFKGYTIQSTINDSVYYESDKHVNKINDSEEQVDTRNWLKDNYEEKVDQINDSDKQVDALSDSEKLVVERSNPKAIQAAIQSKLLKLTTENSHKNY